MTPSPFLFPDTMDIHGQSISGDALGGAVSADVDKYIGVSCSPKQELSATDRTGLPAEAASATHRFSTPVDVSEAAIGDVLVHDDVRHVVRFIRRGHGLLTRLFVQEFIP